MKRIVLLFLLWFGVAFGNDFQRLYNYCHIDNDTEACDGLYDIFRDMFANAKNEKEKTEALIEILNVGKKLCEKHGFNRKWYKGYPLYDEWSKKRTEKAVEICYVLGELHEMGKEFDGAKKYFEIGCKQLDSKKCCDKLTNLKGKGSKK